MPTVRTPQARWHDAFESRGHVELVTAYDCMTARLVEQNGFDGIVVGGGAIANFMYGLPDVGLVSIPEMLDHVRRIAASVDIPVIADVDDGGSTAIHIRRTVEIAERAGAAGIMIEDVDSGYPKHLWDDAKGDWEFSKSVLYPIDVAVRRLQIAMDARRDPQFVIMARTDALHTDPQHGYEVAMQRAHAFAAQGADIVFVLGLQHEQVSRELTTSLGKPLLLGGVGPIDADDKDQVFEQSASYFHGLYPLLAAFSSFKETLANLKQGTPPSFNRDPWEVNRELLTTVDLRGWTDYLSHAHLPARW